MYLIILICLGIVAGSIDEDAKLSFMGLARKYKYPVQSHFITTRDGYILNVFRIPGPKGEPLEEALKQNRPVVLVQHGLTDSSDGHLCNDEPRAPGYMLANEGFDVWLNNNRGTRYSRNHSFLDPDRDNEYWFYDWEEMGFYDQGDVIDFIRDKTGKSKITYMGHS